MGGVRLSSMALAVLCGCSVTRPQNLPVASQRVAERPHQVEPLVAQPAPAEPPPAQPAPPPCEVPDELDILFIGNSYTHMHDLPELVEQLGEQSDIEIHAEMLTMGGKAFDDHLERRVTAETLREHPWDVVVLQSHSLDPLRNRDGFLASGVALVDMVRQTGARPLLFQTWARKAGHNLYNYFRPTGGDPQRMQQAVNRGYAELSTLSGAEVVPVGTAWRRLREVAPAFDPYTTDGAHPSELGSYFTAVMLFSAATGLSPEDNIEPLLGIDDGAAQVLHTHAAAILEPTCPNPDSTL